jgi:pimeloyl-ACP methyl ester carboxylesterase
MLENQILTGAHGRQFAFDLITPSTEKPAEGYPIILFGHGFKGFKDWGHWEAIGKYFASQGYAFLKFNFAFNGTTIDQPLDFADLEGFGQNNFSKELADAQTVLDWLEQNAATHQLNLNDLTMIGHSRGGPIAILTAAKYSRISKVITWAAVHELDYAWQDPEVMEEWKQSGVRHILNGRTKQNMPMYYQIVEDYQENKEAFSVAQALSSLNKPLLILHGDTDPAVPTSSADYLKKHYPSAQLQIIAGGDHVFGGHHPFEGEELPSATKELIASCLDFLRK